MDNQYLTPSALNKYLKAIIDNDIHLKVIKIKGELSNLKYHSNGNMYFNIKDESAQINCIKFGSYKSDEFNEGDSVELEGSLYLYVKSGTYNINVKTMKKHGVGDLLIKYNELKKKLESQGLFDESQKKQIPKFPKKIGVITAKTGAAVKDILITLKNRYPICDVTVYSTLVQGNKSAEDICKNIKYADNDNNDILIVGRGGGSIEDLWSFNEEIVAHAIYNCNTPIISSVGHETDFTISDLVSDVRAATPTAAAQIATPELNVLKQNIISNKNTLTNILKHKIEHENLKIRNLVNDQYFVNPLTRINLNYDELNNLFVNKIHHHRNRLDNYVVNIINFEEKITTQINYKLTSLQSLLENKHNMLDGLNPLAILSRGYATVNIADKVITSTNQVKIGDELNINLHDGMIKSKVVNKENNE